MLGQKFKKPKKLLAENEKAKCNFRPKIKIQADVTMNAYTGLLVFSIKCHNMESRTAI